MHAAAARCSLAQGSWLPMAVSPLILESGAVPRSARPYRDERVLGQGRPPGGPGLSESPRTGLHSSWHRDRGIGIANSAGQIYRIEFPAFLDFLPPVTSQASPRSGSLSSRRQAARTAGEPEWETSPGSQASSSGICAHDALHMDQLRIGDKLPLHLHRLALKGLGLLGVVQLVHLP